MQEGHTSSTQPSLRLASQPASGALDSRSDTRSCRLMPKAGFDSLPHVSQTIQLTRPLCRIVISFPLCVRTQSEANPSPLNHYRHVTRSGNTVNTHQTRIPRIPRQPTIRRPDVRSPPANQRFPSRKAPDIRPTSVHPPTDNVSALYSFPPIRRKDSQLWPYARRAFYSPSPPRPIPTQTSASHTGAAVRGANTSTYATIGYPYAQPRGQLRCRKPAAQAHTRCHGHATGRRHHTHAAQRHRQTGSKRRQCASLAPIMQ